MSSSSRFCPCQARSYSVLGHISKSLSKVANLAATWLEELTFARQPLAYARGSLPFGAATGGDGNTADRLPVDVCFQRGRGGARRVTGNRGLIPNTASTGTVPPQEVVRFLLYPNTGVQRLRRRRKPASPISPKPSNPSEAGSGTLVGWNAPKVPEEPPSMTDALPASHIVAFVLIITTFDASPGDISPLTSGVLKPNPITLPPALLSDVWGAMVPSINPVPARALPFVRNDTSVAKPAKLVAITLARAAEDLGSFPP